MRKFLITILLILQIGLAFTQEVSDLNVVDRDVTMKEFNSYVDGLGSCRKLRKVAQVCSRYGYYDKAVVAYVKMIDKFSRRLNKEDVGDFYACLLRANRIDDVPYVGLQSFSRYFPDLLKIARIRREARDDKIYYDEMRVNCVSSYEKLLFGYSLLDTNRLCVYSDSLNQLFSYEVTTSGFKNPYVYEHGFSEKYNVLHLEKTIAESELYTIYDDKIGLYHIEIISDKLPPFIHNSRYYSTAMPWYDVESQRLFFCADDKRGYGGWDIYYSQLQGNKWLKPVLMNDKVNSLFDDMFPFVNGAYLFFSSDGHKGKGGLDNFAYDMTSDRNFSLMSSNSILDDYCLRLTQDNNSFYMCRGGKILKGGYSSLWPFVIEEKDLDKYLIEQDSSLINRFGLINQKTVKQLIEESCLNLDAPSNINCHNENHSIDYSKNHDVSQGVSQGINQGSGHISDSLPYFLNSIDCDRIIYSQVDAEPFGRRYNKVLNQCIKDVSSRGDVREVLVFASSHIRGVVNSNYLLSLKRASRIVSYMKTFSDESYNYKTILLGDRIYSKNPGKTIG